MDRPVSTCLDPQSQFEPPSQVRGGHLEVVAVLVEAHASLGAERDGSHAYAFFEKTETVMMKMQDETCVHKKI